MADSASKWRRAYAALARGRGSLNKAAEVDLPERPVSEGNLRLSEPSIFYRRMHEELSHFISPGLARRVLDESLDAVAAEPEDVGTFDLRSILVDHLPKRLEVHLSEEHLAAALDALDQVISEMHLPPQIKS